MPYQAKRLFLISSLVFLIFIAMLSLGEVILRLLGLGYGNAPLVSHPVLHHAHPHNYTFTLHTPSDEYGGNRVYFDENGLVADPEKKSSGNKTLPIRIAFMGDSFVEGIQVAYPDSFIGILQSTSKHISEIRNYGVSSYSPIHYLLQWRKEVSKFKPTHVFLLLFSNDIETDKEMSESAIYSEDGELLRLPSPDNKWLSEQLRKSYLIRFIRKAQLKLKWIIEHRNENANTIAGNYVEINPDISNLSGNLIKTLDREVKRSGGRFILMATPSKYRLNSGDNNSSELEFSDKCKKWAKDSSIEFLDLVDPFKKAKSNGSSIFFTKDIHFNKTGHKIVAEILRRAYPEIFIETNQFKTYPDITTQLY